MMSGENTAATMQLDAPPLRLELGECRVLDVRFRPKYEVIHTLLYCENTGGPRMEVFTILCLVELHSL